MSRVFNLEVIEFLGSGVWEGSDMRKVLLIFVVFAILGLLLPASAAVVGDNFVSDGSSLSQIPGLGVASIIPDPWDVSIIPDPWDASIIPDPWD